MSRCRIILVALLGLLIPAFAAAQGNVATKTQPQASQIVCPLQELEWGVTTPLPDPWWSPSFKVPYVYGPATWPTVINGKEALNCRYEDGSTQYMALPPELEWPAVSPTALKAFVIRPLNINSHPSQWPCPPTVQVGARSQLPPPWLGTYYVWNLEKKWSHDATLLYSNPYDVCEYTPGGSDQQPKRIFYLLEPLSPTGQAAATGLAANPVPLPTPNDLKQTFLVTKADLTAIPPKQAANCPATVRFEGRIGANGPGQVRWRREINGQPGPIQTLGFSAPGDKVVKFEIKVDAAQQQSGGLMLTTQAQPSNVVNGLAKIVIVSPAGVSESSMTSYEVICNPLAPAGNLAQTPLPPEPTPSKLAAPTPSSDPAPSAIAAAPQPTGRGVSQPQAIASPSAVSAATAALPDLRVTAAEVNRARPGVLRVQVINSGQAPSGATRVRVWTAEGKAWYGAVPTLTPGQETWVMVRADIPPDAAKIHARVDDPDRVKESDETNNELTSDVPEPTRRGR